MSERDNGLDQSDHRMVYPSPMEKMYDFIAQRTMGSERLEIEAFQKFGNVNIRIVELEEQIRSSSGHREYVLGNGASIPLSVQIINPLEAGAYRDLLGKIANRIDREYFKDSDSRETSAEIVEFARSQHRALP